MDEFGPGEEGSEEALNSAVAGTLVSPAGNTSHGHAASHGEKREDTETHVAECGGCQTRAKAVEQCYNIHGLWLSSVVGFATTTLHPKPLYIKLNLD